LSFVRAPPGRELNDALGAFESFIHAEDSLLLLVRMAMIHYQFEAIHPFFDGNGRVGRILISLLLCANGRLSQPLLYMSSYFEHRRDAYVDHMLAVSQRGEWIPWIRFFLQRGHRPMRRRPRTRAASQIVEKLVKAKILVEITGRPRDRVFLAKELVAVIER
jgi:Fic family protein